MHPYYDISRSVSGTKGVRRGHRGSQTIEGALITLIMFGLIFLIFDMAFSLYIKSTLQEAARDGVRFAITGQMLPGDSYLNDSIVKTVQSSALGLLSGPNDACKVSVNYYDPYGGASTSATGGYVVQVSVTGVQYTPLAAILKDSAPVMVNVQASDVMEACPAAGCPSTANPAPPACP
jgi:Flp pilus assembly protein TadG